MTEDGEVVIPSRWVKGTIAVLSWAGRDVGPCASALFNAVANGRLDDVNGKTFLAACARLPIEDFFKKVEEGTRYFTFCS